MMDVIKIAVIHRQSCLSYVVEVSVWNFLLSCQLLHLIQEDVHLEFRAQVLQAAVAERLPVKHHHNGNRDNPIKSDTERQTFVERWYQSNTHTGPLIMRAIITFMSPMYSVRSG